MSNATSDESTLVQAAVLVPLLSPRDSQSQPLDLTIRVSGYPELRLSSHTEVLLTVRSDRVEHHKGQISFPGGVHESHDLHLLRTALRESEEEVGISAQQIEILGELPSIQTVATRFLITPFVGLIRNPPELRPNPHEILEILRVPISHLLAPENSRLENWERGSVRFVMRSYYFGRHRIWGATARILESFLENTQHRVTVRT